MDVCVLSVLCVVR